MPEIHIDLHFEKHGDFSDGVFSFLFFFIHILVLYHVGHDKRGHTRPLRSTSIFFSWRKQISFMSLIVGDFPLPELVQLEHMVVLFMGDEGHFAQIREGI